MVPKYKPSQEWFVMSKDRERAMASRRVGGGTRLARYAKKHSQVFVRMDNRKASLCNRRIVKQILPPVRDCAPRPP